MSVDISGFSTWLQKTKSSIWPEIIHENQPKLNDLRSAAIMIILIKNGISTSDYSIVITLRSKNVPTHKGQCAFPGGGQKDNELLLNTAIRETKEETSIEIDFHESEWELLGEYPVKFITISDYLVTPFIVIFNATNGSTLDFMPDKYEIEEVFDVPLSHLLDPVNTKIESREWEGVNFKINYFYYKDKVIWGVTGMILDHFLKNIMPYIANQP